MFLVHQHIHIMIIMEPQIKHTFLVVVYFCKQQKTGFILSHLLHQSAFYIKMLELIHQSVDIR